MATPQEILSSLGHFGYIKPSDRTQNQMDAHIAAVSSMPRFSVPGYVEPAGPVKIMLTDYWKHPLVVADIGMPFIGIHQVTGSCVAASEGDVLCTVGCVQRVVSDTPTKAFIPWWLFPYGLCRQAEGDRGEGEGAIDSVMGQTLKKYGIFDINAPGLPPLKKDDGIYTTKQVEMTWSSARNISQDFISLAAKFPLGTAAPMTGPADVKKAITSGYGILYGCDMFVSRGEIKGEGENAYVRGVYDHSGGHSTGWLGYWDHPNDGPLYLYSNQWPTDTYPTDPAGAGRCCVWIPESEVQKAFDDYGSGGGEAMALSNVNYFPAQPAVISGMI